MKHKVVGLLPLAGLVFGCAAYRVAGDVQQGRTQLITGKPESALPYFQQAAEKDPNYVKSNGYFQEGVWTYVGRTQYTLGQYQSARQALERAVSQNDRDYLAKLYLGLTVAREGDRQRGANQIETGMKDLHNWLEYIQQNTTYGTYWDPRREIRSAIESDLAMISSRDIDWPKLTADGEWVGKQTEEEIDKALRDEHRAYDDGDGRRSHRR